MCICATRMSWMCSVDDAIVLFSVLCVHVLVFDSITKVRVN